MLKKGKITNKKVYFSKHLQLHELTPIMSAASIIISGMGFMYLSDLISVEGHKRVLMLGKSGLRCMAS